MILNQWSKTEWEICDKKKWVRIRATKDMACCQYDRTKKKKKNRAHLLYVYINWVRLYVKWSSKLHAKTNIYTLQWPLLLYGQLKANFRAWSQHAFTVHTQINLSDGLKPKWPYTRNCIYFNKCRPQQKHKQTVELCQSSSLVIAVLKSTMKIP